MPTVTLGSVVQQVYDRLENNDRFYRRDRVRSVINDAVRVLNLLTGYIQRTFFAPGFTIPNRCIYGCPRGVLIPLRVELEGRELRKTSMANLSKAHTEWLRDTTDSVGMPTELWAPMGLRAFVLWPAPSQGGLSLRMTAVVEPQELTSDNSVIEFPNEYAEAFEDLSTHVNQLKEGGAIFAQSGSVYQAFLGKAKELNQFQSMKMPQYYVERETPK